MRFWSGRVLFGCSEVTGGVGGGGARATPAEMRFSHNVSFWGYVCGLPLMLLGPLEVRGHGITRGDLI